MTNATLVTPLSAQRTTVGMPPWAKLGVIFGLVSAASIALYGPIGVSGTYSRFVGAIMRAVAPAYAAANPYVVKMGSLVTPETFLVIGLLIGGFVSAWLGSGRAPKAEAVHANETTTGRRYLNAFLGGVLILFGSRLAGGCTSGHIISGMTQLAISGMLFTAAVFTGGMMMARLTPRAH